MGANRVHARQVRVTPESGGPACEVLIGELDTAAERFQRLPVPRRPIAMRGNVLRIAEATMRERHVRPAHGFPLSHQAWPGAGGCVWRALPPRAVTLRMQQV